MSERIFELNGFYVTSVAAPFHQGPLLEFHQSYSSDNPRLDETEVRLLVVALSAWISDRVVAREHRHGETHER